MEEREGVHGGEGGGAWRKGTRCMDGEERGEKGNKVSEAWILIEG